MGPLSKQFSELVSLTKLHILQETSKGAWLFAEPSAYQHLKDFALKKRNACAPAPPSPSRKEVKPAPVPLPPPLPQKKAPVAAVPPVQQEPLSTTAPAAATPAFDRQPITPSLVDDFSDLCKIVEKAIPPLQILKELPKELPAASRRQPQALVIIDEGTPELPAAFLTNLATAIDRCLCPAKTLRLKKEQLPAAGLAESIKILIGTTAAVDSLSSHLPAAQTVYLEPLESYMEHPLQKASLWKKLSTTCFP